MHLFSLHLKSRSRGACRHRSPPALARRVASALSLLAITTSAVVTIPLCETECAAMEWRGYGQLEGQLAFTSGPIAPSLPSVAPGFQASLGAGPQGIPFMLGLNVGPTALGSHEASGPYALHFNSDGLHGGSTTVKRDFSLQDIQLALRFEPEWHRVRPFLEAAGGVAIMGESDSLEGDDGYVYESSEKKHSVAPSFSYALGIDIEPWERRAPDNGTVGLAITLGVRSTYFGSFDYVQPLVDSSNAATWQSTSGTLHTWTAFVGLTLALESGPPAKRDDEGAVRP